MHFRHHIERQKSTGVKNFHVHNDTEKNYQDCHDDKNSNDICGVFLPSLQRLWDTKVVYIYSVGWH